MTPALTLVTDAPETAAQRAARRHIEAEELAAAAIEEMLATLNMAWAAAEDIADLKAAPPGVRDECRRLASHLAGKADTIMAILGRGR